MPCKFVDFFNPCQFVQLPTTIKPFSEPLWPNIGRYVWDALRYLNARKQHVLQDTLRIFG